MSLKDLKSLKVILFFHNKLGYFRIGVPYADIHALRLIGTYTYWRLFRVPVVIVPLTGH